MTKTKFIHLRNVANNGSISNFGGMTIAYHQIEPGFYKVGFAKCHSGDNFNKALGRAKAQGRMHSDKQSMNISATNKQSLITQVTASAMF